MSHLSRRLQNLCLLILSLFAVLIVSSNRSFALTLYQKDGVAANATIELAARYEYWEWFSPEKQDDDQNCYGFFFTRSRLGLGLTGAKWGAFLQLQDVHMWGLPDESISSAPAGPLGAGAIYFAHGRQSSYHSTAIRKAYIESNDLPLKGLCLKVGRFDYTDGLEVTYNEKKLNWIKKMRVAERLIGPFIWSSFWRSFDGLKLALDKQEFNITGIVTHPTQGGFENDIQTTIYGVDLATLTGTIKYDTLFKENEARLFYFYYQDKRRAPKADNTPSGSGLNSGSIIIHTIGAHLVGIHPAFSGSVDWLLWGALQTGDWGRLEHRAWAWALEFGYQFDRIKWSPWIRVGYEVGSGDDDPEDMKHHTFYQLVPTTRKYALFPFYNMMNSEDLFIQAILRPSTKVSIRTDLHRLRLRSGSDRWYMGAGPTQDDGSIFGYVGRPCFGDQDLGMLLDITLIYRVSSHLWFTAYYGHVFGQDVIKNIYPRDRNADYAYLEMGIRF